MVITSQESDVIGIAIVDDHPIALRGIDYLLADVDDIKVVAAADSVEELRRQLADAPDGPTPDVILLDLYHDGDTACLEAIAELATSTRVLVISASGRPEDVTGAIRAGACGYITKNTPLEMFRTAIYTAAGGGFWLSSKLADILCTELSNHRPPPQAPKPSDGAQPLAPREEETLSLIARGFTHTQVATRMGISRATVDTYVERIRTKLQLGNKAELTRAALARAAEHDQR
ncbi:response regulator transcription factor [Actinacidiphila oryziradicis]|uniref:Response regulator transcription factor n=1 Tax=Actinacidiphila oryziradicis TaxID=2571141 RepID=A0A4U0SH84_9ACTN|nr:response regulator transcription factor [Actinacidiphila oryziradicis]